MASYEYSIEKLENLKDITTEQMQLLVSLAIIERLEAIQRAIVGVAQNTSRLGGR